jgi:chromate reductase
MRSMSTATPRCCGCCATFDDYHAVPHSWHPGQSPPQFVQPWPAASRAGGCTRHSRHCEFDLTPIPPFNEDIETHWDPPSVRQFKEQIHEADALLIATPEYNYSIPGVLKNAIDWASRAAHDSPLRHKPIALMGASTDGFGTVRSQLALCQTFFSTKSYVLLEPEVRVSAARDKFDTEGNLIDAQTRKNVLALVTALVDWARLLTAERRVDLAPQDLRRAVTFRTRT